MAEPYYLIDSNAVIDYLSSCFPKSGMSFMNDVVDSIANVSVITKMEVLVLMVLKKILKRHGMFDRPGNDDSNLTLSVADE